MIKFFYISLLIAVIVSSCAVPDMAALTSVPPTVKLPIVIPSTQPADTPPPTLTPVCISSEPTQKDIDRALSYTHEIFDESDWEKNFTFAENRVSVTWLNNAQGAIVYLEVIIFPCSYEESDLNKYYSNESWEIIFQNYESYELMDECKTDAGLRLYEFETKNQGFEYGVRYWVSNDTDTRVISSMIVFPLESQSMLDEYSSMLFPDYSTCP
jgi:hypothetical protein